MTKQVFLWTNVVFTYKKKKLLKNIITCLFFEKIQIFIYLCALSEFKINICKAGKYYCIMDENNDLCLLPIEPQIYIQIVREFCWLVRNMQCLWYYIVNFEPELCMYWKVHCVTIFIYQIFIDNYISLSGM